MIGNKNQQDLSLRHSSRHGWVHLRTLIAVRWIGIAGQIGGLAAATMLLDYDLPLRASGATIAASIILNLWAVQRAQRGPTISERVAAGYLAFDILQLALLLFLTGGLLNPFAMLLLAPLTVGAAILRRRLIVGLTSLMIGAASALAFAPQTLPWADASFPPIFLFGIWMALVLSALFITLYVYSVATGTAQITAALQETQLALSRTQKLAAIGALAAAAAHELGTPLSTIAVVAKELAREMPPESEQAEDAALLLSQVDRCRRILADLAQRPDRTGDINQPFNSVGLETFLTMVAAPYQTARVTFQLVLAETCQGSEPQLRQLPELQHGLANLLQNAMQFAASRVTVYLDWRPGFLELRIHDDGPGMSPAILDRVGEPYISSRTASDGHMGLGIFIALNLLEKAGATVQYDNLPQGGTATIVTWQDATALRIITA